MFIDSINNENWIRKYITEVVTNSESTKQLLWSYACLKILVVNRKTYESDLTSLARYSGQYEKVILYDQI